MKIRLYLDEDSMSRALLQGLRARNVDVVSALDDGMIERNDKEHLEHATDTGRVLYSYNVGDFCRLHADFLSEGREHAGIVLVGQRQYVVGVQLRRLLKLIAALSPNDMRNRVEFLSAWSEQ